jgi:hypothetical protein
VPTIKIVLQHTRAIAEGEARYRNISKIFLENEIGERIACPTNRPGIARAYARVLAEGDKPYGDRWNHINSILEDYNKIAGFVRATRSGVFSESTGKLIELAESHYLALRETLKKLGSHRGYTTYFDNWSPVLNENADDADQLTEIFTDTTLDPRIEAALPILGKLSSSLVEVQNDETDSLAEWADSIISEKLEMDSTTKSMAVPADKMLDEAPGAETLAHNQSTEKSNLKAFGLAEEDDDKVVSIKARKKPFVGALAKDFDDEFGHYDELGHIGKLASINRGSEDDMDWDDDSWIPDEEDFEHEEMAKELSRHRGRFAANDLREMDKSPEANPYSGQGHRKGDDNASRGPDKTAKMMAAKQAVKMARKALDKAFKGDVDENFISMAPQAVAEDEVEESGLQAYLGKKKYGEKGMKALQQAGRDGASKEKMATIRAKHDKLDEVQVEEDLDANQKRVGQLGPTEKVKNNNIGKLVGANESTEIAPELARIIEMARFNR